MTKQTHNQIRSNQEGIVAIIVAVTLTVVMSLIILAIAQSSNREQRQSLDRQLSDQAFYNAESGINDVANYLYKNLQTIPAIPIDKTTCLPEIPTSGGVTINYTLPDASGTNKYTCLMYDKAPKTIQYDSLSLSSPKVVPIQAVNDAGSPVVVHTLTFSWDDATDRNAAIGCNIANELPDACTYGGLRVESVTPGPTRDVIRQASLIAFMLPTTAASSDIVVGALSYPESQGILSNTTCNGPAGTRRCSKTISGIDRSTLYLSLRSLYQPINLTISGKDAGGTDVRFKDSQVVIDSTGKASDVLRRVQVRVPANSQYSYPGFAIQSRDSICKILTVTKNEDGTGIVDSFDAAACPVN